MNPVLRAVAIFALGVVLGVGGFALFGPRGGAAAVEQGPGKSARAGDARRAVVALGTIEPRDGVVQVSSPLVGTPIQKVLVQDGQFVQAGDVLIELDPAAAEAEHALALAVLAEGVERQQTEIALGKEKVTAAELAVKQAQEGRQLEIDAAQARIKVGEAKYQQAEKDAQRLENLSKLAEPLASAQQIEQQQVLLGAAAAELDAARVAAKRIEQTLAFQQQTTEAELRAAKMGLSVAEKGAGLETLKRRVDLAALKLKQNKIVAPSSGVVLGVGAHAGEVVVQQPLLQLADLDHLVCVTEVDAGDVSRLQASHEAEVTCRALGDVKLSGTIDRVGSQVSPAMLRPLDPRKPVDRNVAKAIVQIDAQKAARLVNAVGKDRRAALVGLQVEVAFPLAKDEP